VIAWLAEVLASQPKALALSAGNETLCYRELAAAASHRARALSKANIPPGSRVALALGADPLENALWIHALLGHGATFVPLGPNVSSARRDRLLRRLGIDALVSLQQEPGAAPGDCEVIDGLQLPGREPDAEWPGRAPRDPDSIACIVLTSGSGAEPKAVPLTPAQLDAGVHAVRRRLHLNADDQWLCCMPLDHIAGLSILIRALRSGASVRLVPGFNPTRVLAELDGRPLTVASMVPTMLHDLLVATAGPISNRLRGLLVGGAPAAPELLECARARGLPVLPTWGMTEAGSQLATLDLETAAEIDFLRNPGLVGTPLDGVELSIGGARHPRALRVRGPMLFSGYLDGDAPGPDAGGWFATGDTGWIDGHGRLHITGRLGRMLISGGVNVSLDAVEQTLRTSGLVRELVVAALPHSRWGQRIGALFVARDGARPRTADALRDWSNGHLEPAERPIRWVEVNAIPKTDTGKPHTREVLAMLQAEPRGGMDS